MVAMMISRAESHRNFETSSLWIKFTLGVSFFALFIHSAGQTMFFSHGYFEEPNLYHTWDRFDEVTHPLSSCAITSIILNFNLPLSFRKKWFIALIFGIIGGISWELLEYAVAPYGLVRVTFVDT